MSLFDTKTVEVLSLLRQRKEAVTVEEMAEAIDTRQISLPDRIGYLVGTGMVCRTHENKFKLTKSGQNWCKMFI